MRTLTALLTTLALAAPTTSIAAAHVGAPTGGAHAAHTITAQAIESSAPAGFGGPATTYEATITPPHHPGCGATRHVPAQENGEAIDAGDPLHFTAHAPHGGWCAGRYRVVATEHASPAASVDSTNAAPAPAAITTTVLSRTSFRVG
jgi:hypothetical protein